MYYYVEWNKKIIESNRAILVHQVENGLNDKLCDFLGIVKPNNFYDDKKANSYDKHKKILNICDISNGLLKDKFLNLSEPFRGTDAPVNPKENQIWINDDGNKYVYFYDGDTYQWIAI